jgi:hypothetical protein
MSGGGSKDTTVSDTPEQRHAAQVAAEKWNFAQETLAPLENEYMKRVEDMGSESRSSYIRGATNQSMMAGLDTTTSRVNQQLGGGGINPNSGKWQGTTADAGSEVAAVGGETMGRGLYQQDQEQVRGLQNIIAIGSGKEGTAQNGLNRIASTSAADARSDASTALNRRSANLQLVNMAAGAGTSYALNRPAGGLNLQGQSQPLTNNSAFVGNM